MIWIPIASILVFIATLAISIYLGYKRGWRAALFIAIVFLALNATILGVEAAIYKSTLWGLYKSWFMKDEMRIQGIDYDLLASHYKVRVLLIFAGFISPITYAVTFGIYFLLKKPLYNYLMPRVKEVSSNEKELIYRKNPRPARITGAVISGTTAIFASSFFASAANVLVTPREHENAFNKFNDVLGRIYAFGLGGNTEEAKAISQFLRNVDGKFVQDIKDLIRFDYTKNEFDGTDQTNKSVASQIEQYKFLFESKEATEAIFSAIVSSRMLSTPFNVIDFGFNIAKDADGNSIGVDQNDSGTRKITALATYVATKNIVPSELPIFARAALFEKLKEGLSTWDSSIFAIELKEAQNEQAAQTRMIKDLKERLDDLNAYRKNSEQEQQKYIDQIRQYAGFSSNAESTTNNNVVLADGSHPTHNNVRTVAEEKVGRTDDAQNNVHAATSDSTIYKEYQIEKDLQAVLQTKTTAYNVALTNRDSFKNGDYSLINAEFTRLTGIRDSFQSKLNNDQRDLNTITATLNANEVALKNLESDLAQTTNTKNNLINSIIPTRQVALTNAENLKATASTNLTRVQNEASALQNVLAQAQSEQSLAQTAYDTQVAKKAPLENQLATAKEVLRLAIAERDKHPVGSKEYNDAQVPVTTAQNEVNRVAGLIKDLETAINSAKATLDQAIKNVQNKQNDVNAKNREVQSAQSALSSVETNRVNAENALNQAKNELTQATNRITTLNNNIQSKTAEIASNKASQTTATNIVEKDKADLAQAQAELDKFKTASSSIVSNGATFRFGYNAAVAMLNDLEGKLTFATNEKNDAQHAFEAQRAKVDKFISDTNTNLSNLRLTNVQIRNYNNGIDYLMDHDPQYQFDLTADHANWSKGAEPVGEESIYYAEQKLLYWNNKVSQREIINRTMKMNYDSLKQQLTDSFKLYTIPDER